MEGLHLPLVGPSQVWVLGVRGKDGGKTVHDLLFPAGDLGMMDAVRRGQLTRCSDLAIHYKLAGKPNI